MVTIDVERHRTILGAMPLRRFGMLILLAPASVAPARAASTAACSSDDPRQMLFNLIAWELAQTVARDPGDLRYAVPFGRVLSRSKSSTPASA
jgi:hypothetical protein